MFERVLERARCPQCHGGLDTHIFNRADNGHIRDGLALCKECGAGYPIDNELLLLGVPELMPQGAANDFFAKFGDIIAGRGIALRAAPPGVTTQDYRAQREQRDHFDWFAKNDTLDYSDYVKTPVWKAADALAFRRWKRTPMGNCWLLDVGCANGRATLPMAGDGMTVAGMDVSELMLRQAVEASKRDGSHCYTCFLLADGNDLPFADNSFDRVMTYGVLHHLPNPEHSCMEFQRVLSPGGVYLGSENHESPLRPLFDLSMRLFPLWREKAGVEPLISKAKLEAWHAGADVQIEERYGVFLPPHLFNLLGARLAYACMGVTDAIMNALPVVRKAGGLIVYEVRSCGR